MKNILVTKRDGVKENFDPDKIHKILFWATKDLSGVSVSQIESKAQLQVYPGITTKEIHDILIQSAAELISTDAPNYQWVAARLRLFQIRKIALGQFEPLPIVQVVKRNIDLGFYTPELLEWYDSAEWNVMEDAIEHKRDFNHAYAGMEQFNGKYLVQDRTTKQVYETPQYLNMLVSACIFHKYPKDIRMEYVVDFYNELSTGVISLPTPIMGGLRTKTKQFSSCTLIECSDTLDSINATSNAIVKYISKKAGIGLEGGHIRAVDSKIRGGEIRHTGIQPFYRLFQSSVKSCCLVPETIIEVLDATANVVKIELRSLIRGMSIKTIDNNGELCFKKVTDVWDTVVKTEDQLIVSFENGTVVRCSSNHPIMVREGQNVVQKYPLDLTENDVVITDVGTTKVANITNDNRDKNYIDITVEDTHTFFCASSKTSEMVLTHNSQGGIRGGAATLYAPLWHLEIENILTLRSTKRAEETAVRHMDYGIQFNGLMYERLLKGQNITLFSPHEVEEMHAAFFNDQAKFKKLYEENEKRADIMKKSIPAIELFSMFHTQRAETGRIYKINVDHTNTHGPFDESVAPIKMSNLCVAGDTQITIVVDGVEKNVHISSLGEYFNEDCTPNKNILVKSKNVDSDVVEFKTIKAFAMTNKSAKTLRISDVDSGKTLVCTPDHLVYTKNRGYVEAKNLKVDDELDI